MIGRWIQMASMFGAFAEEMGLPLLYQSNCREDKVMEIGNWVVCRTNKGNVEGTITKINAKKIKVRLQAAGKYKTIERRYRDVIEVIEW